MQTRSRLTRAIFVLSLVFPSAVCLGFPMSLNYIPTAETVGAGRLLLEFSSYGYSTIFTTESTVSVNSQVGIGDRLEFGADKYEAEDFSETYLNAKLKLFHERRSAPSLAAGVMDINRLDCPTSYWVASKTLGSVRAHVGHLQGAYATGVMWGVDLDLSDQLWFAVDYLPGEANHLRFGLSHNLGSDSYALFSVGLPNNPSAAATELSVTFGAAISLGR